MPDRMDILHELQSQQKKPELMCNPGSLCWCAQLLFKFDAPMNGARCMTPLELLIAAGNQLTLSDKRYLTSLLGRELVE